MLSEADTRKVAKLARLALSEEEIAGNRASLSSVLSYVERINSIDLAGVEPMAHVHAASNRLDEDQPGPTLPRETLMRLAPESLPPFIKVPKVIDAGD